MKKIFSIMIALVLTLSCLPLSLFAVSAEETNTVKRYSVLVLDVSDTASFIGEHGETIYTAPSAIEYVKQSANSFLMDLINAKGENYVAVVSFNETATVVSDFTDDIDSVTKEVNDLVASDKVRDINTGLAKANMLLDSIETDAVKNVVLVTTGMTNAGESDYDGKYSEETIGSEWRRMDTDIRLYAYANAALKTASITKDKATLYVLGLFQTMEEIPEEGKEVAEFFRLTASDLATSVDTFYDVEDPNQIEFAFGEIANDIISATGLFKYAGQIVQDYDSTADYCYSDSYFRNSANILNRSLATMSLCLELSTWSSYDHDNWYNPSITLDDTKFFDDKLCNVKTLLIGNPNAGEGFEGIGFSNFKANSFWQNAPTKDSIGVCAAKKNIKDINGEEYTLIALVVRGGGYGSEWASNFTIGKTGEHDGFATARDNVLSFLDSYINSELNEEDSKHIKIWTTGFSRAGATANMVSGALNTYHSLPNGTFTEPENIYCYTFEAPQGAVRSSLKGDYSNIHNILNLNDLVPLVAPYSWNFSRYNYQNDVNLPSKYTVDSKKFNKQLNAMLYELRTGLGYENIEYKISEESTMKNFKVDKSKFLPFGDPLWWFEDSSVDTHWVLSEGVNFLADDVIPSREYYYNNLEHCVRQLLGILMDYYGVKNGLVNYAGEVAIETFMIDLKELFTFDNITYIVSPMLSLNPFKSFDARKAEVKNRLAEKVGGIFGELAYIDGFIDSIIDILGDVIIQVCVDIWNNNTDSINLVCKVVDTLASSEMQGHFPEICLAWCRSLDSNFNDSIVDSNSSVSRVIRINCPVDVVVYDSMGNIQASMINNEVDSNANDIVYYINNKGEKLFYLPGDETYTIDITATDNGTVNYSVSEYNFIYQNNTRLENYYDVPILTGENLKAIVPIISTEELQNNSIDGSNVQYEFYHNNELVSASEKFKGEEVTDLYFDISLKTEGNGGYVDGAGHFLKGSFAKVNAYTLTGGEFLGWYNGDTLVSSDEEYRFAVTENIELSAHFSDVPFSPVKFVCDEGGTVSNVETEYPNGATVVLEAIAMSGYTFDGWSASKDIGILDANAPKTEFKMIDSEVTIFAHFKKSGIYTITLNADGGFISNNTLYTDVNGKLIDIPKPSKDGYDFDGWFTSDDDLVTEDTIFTENSTLIASWKEYITSTNSTTEKAQNSTTVSNKETTTTVIKTDSPKTGDDFDSSLIVSILFISLGVVVFTRKKKYTN